MSFPYQDTSRFSRYSDLSTQAPLNPSFNRSRSRENSKFEAHKSQSSHHFSSNHSKDYKKQNSPEQPFDKYKSSKSIERKGKPRVINLNIAVNKKLMDPRKIAIDRLLTRKMEKNQYFKLNLVLDIDETLVSSLFKPEEVSLARNLISGQTHNVKYSNLKVKIVGEETCNILVLYRPKLRFFLENMAKYFNIFIYSHGMSKYVSEILNDIDPDCKLINRNNIIANSQKNQVSDTAKKCLSKLNLNDKENLRKTLIIDDILNVWMEEYSKNVIISKKFIPFFDISENKTKNSGYYVVFDKEIKQYLSFAPQNTEYYIDKTLHEYGAINQLEKITNKLVDISFLYNKNMMFFNDCEMLDVAYLLELELLKIMKGICVAINEIENLGKVHINIQHVTKQLIEKMGGSHVSQAEMFRNRDVKYLILDKDNLEKKQILIDEITKLVRAENEENKRELELIDNKWISDCYFNMCLIDPAKYRISYGY